LSVGSYLTSWQMLFSFLVMESSSTATDFQKLMGLCWRILLWACVFVHCDLHIHKNSEIERWCKFTMHYAWNKEDRKVWLLWCESCV
jgi:hypothetical protein